MNGFLLDTHIWLWHILDDERLGRGLNRVIDRTPTRCWLSPVSIWELALLVERGRMTLDVPLREWVDEALTRVPLSEARMTNAVAIQGHNVQLRERDPSDRLLAATAIVYDLTLLTVDPNLTEASWLKTRSR